MAHICVSKLTIIGPDNSLSPRRRQAIIWTNDGILLIGPLGTNFSEILAKIITFSFKKMHLKMSFGKWRPFCLGLNVLSKVCCWDPHGWSPIQSDEPQWEIQQQPGNQDYPQCNTTDAKIFAITILSFDPVHKKIGLWYHLQDYVNVLYFWMKVTWSEVKLRHGV